MHFGEPLDDERLVALLRPGDGIDTVITADTYGAGRRGPAAGSGAGRRAARDFCAVGAVGHDFYEGERDGPRGFPRFTDPRAARHPATTPTTCAWPPSAASSAAALDSLRRAAAAQPRPHGLHQRGGLGRDGRAARGRAGRRHRRGARARQRLHARPRSTAWSASATGSTGPWSSSTRSSRGRASWRCRPPPSSGVRVITRVVDYGGLFCTAHLCRRPSSSASGDHRGFRPEGWVERGLERLERMRPVAERHGLTPLQLACQWNLAHPAVACCAPDPDPGGGRRARGRSRSSAPSWPPRRASHC